MPALFDHKGNTQTLEILMQDDVIGLEVRLLYGVFEKEDVITRSVIIKNHSKENVKLTKFFLLILIFHMEILILSILQDDIPWNDRCKDHK